MGRLREGWRWYRTVPVWKWPNCHGSEHIPPLWAHGWFGRGAGVWLWEASAKIPHPSPLLLSSRFQAETLPCPLPPSKTWTWLPTWSCLVTGGFVWRSGLWLALGIVTRPALTLAQTPLECTLASEDAAPACLVMTQQRAHLVFRAASLCCTQCWSSPYS